MGGWGEEKGVVGDVRVASKSVGLVGLFVCFILVFFFVLLVFLYFNF